jgi:hypothetical protein
MHGRLRNAHKIFVEKPVRDHLGDLDTSANIILKQIFYKLGVEWFQLAQDRD